MTMTSEQEMEELVAEISVELEIFIARNMDREGALLALHGAKDRFLAELSEFEERRHAPVEYPPELKEYWATREEISSRG